jgi:hypothetical protein
VDVDRIVAGGESWTASVIFPSPGSAASVAVPLLVHLHLASLSLTVIGLAASELGGRFLGLGVIGQC